MLTWLISYVYTHIHTASKCIRLLNDTPDIILSKIDTHSIQCFSFISSSITYNKTRLSAMKGVLYATNGFNSFPYRTTPYYVKITSHARLSRSLCVIIIIFHHITTIITLSTILRTWFILNEFMSPPRETHGSGYWFNGLTSRQQSLFL